MGKSAKDDERSVTSAGHASEWFGRLALIAAEAAGVRVSEARIRVLAHDLAGYSRPQVERAFTMARREGSGFFPTPAELIRYIEGTADDRGLLAWEAFVRAAAEVGSYRNVDVDDAAAAYALTSVFGSWPEFCAHETGPDLLVKRQSFLAAYRQARRAGASGTTRLPGALPGPAGDVGHVALDGSVELRLDHLLSAGDVRRLTEGRRDGEEGEDEQQG